jgi:hypothetical protein
MIRKPCEVCGKIPRCRCKMIIGLKGASGLGDTIYAYPIVKYYAKMNDEVYYMTDYPEIYETLENVKCSKHQKLNYIVKEDGEKQPVDVRFTYCGRKYTPGTSQFTDSCLSAGIRKPLDLEIPWTIKNKKLIAKVKRQNKNKKKICILAAPYEPFGREDEWGAILRIKPKIMQNIVNEYKDRVFFIQTGNKYTLHKIKNVDMDLIKKTTVSDLFDLIKICDIGLSQIGNMLPLCECQKKKNFIIYARAGLKCDNRFISSITPEKTTHYRKLNFSAMDNEIDKAVIEFDNLLKA